MMDIVLHTQNTPWGSVVVGFCDNQMCHLSFAQTRTQAEQNVSEDFPQAHMQWIQRTDLDADQLIKGPHDLALLGTPFQIKVWTELQNIPFGQTLSYSELAARLQMPTATRAVASAVARNKIALCIPCHRIIRANGSWHKYRWGTDVKKRILTWEQGS